MERPELDIEAALKQDLSGTYKAQLLAELSAEANKIRGELNRGVGPEDYKRLESLLGATETAATVVEKVWNQIHVH